MEEQYCLVEAEHGVSVGGCMGCVGGGGARQVCDRGPLGFQGRVRQGAPRGGDAFTWPVDGYG